MKDLSKRLPTTAVLIVFAYCSIRFLPDIYFSALIYILISLAAWEFIKFLSRPGSQRKLYEAAPAKQDTYLPPNRSSWEGLEMKKELKDVLISQAEGGTLFANRPSGQSG